MPACAAGTKPPRELTSAERLANSLVQFLRRVRFAEQDPDAEPFEVEPLRAFGQSGHHEHGQVTPDLADLLRELKPGHPRHGVVRHQDIEVAGTAAEVLERD